MTEIITTTLLALFLYFCWLSRKRSHSQRSLDSTTAGRGDDLGHGRSPR